MFFGGAEDARACFQPRAPSRDEPRLGPGQEVEALLAQDAAVGPLLRLADLLDPRGVEAVAEEVAEDLVVALAEGLRELRLGDRPSGRGERVAPGDPVVAGRVDRASRRGPTARRPPLPTPIAMPPPGRRARGAGRPPSIPAAPPDSAALSYTLHRNDDGRRGAPAGGGAMKARAIATAAVLAVLLAPGWASAAEGIAGQACDRGPGRDPDGARRQPARVRRRAPSWTGPRRFTPSAIATSIEPDARIQGFIGYGVSENVELVLRGGYYKSEAVGVEAGTLTGGTLAGDPGRREDLRLLHRLRGVEPRAGCRATTSPTAAG